MVSSGKKLRGKDDFNNFYIDLDWPPITAKALAALRTRAYEHRRDHPDGAAYVKNGQLYIDGTSVASVDLK